MIKTKQEEQEENEEEEEKEGGSDDGEVDKFVNRRNVTLTRDYANYERLCRGQQTRVSTCIFH